MDPPLNPWELHFIFLFKVKDDLNSTETTEKHYTCDKLEN